MLQKALMRFITLVLVPCLVVDPSIAASLGAGHRACPKGHSIAGVDSATPLHFTCQAVPPPLTLARPPSRRAFGFLFAGFVPLIGLTACAARSQASKRTQAPQKKKLTQDPPKDPLSFFVPALLASLAMATVMPLGRRAMAGERLRWPVRVWLFIFRNVLERFAWIQVDGLEELPTGSALLAGPHPAGPLDAILLASALYSREGRWPRAVAQPAFFNRVTHWFLKGLIIPVEASGGTIAAVQSQLTHAGTRVIIFPNGKDDRNSQYRRRWQPGVAIAAVRADVPIVPFFLAGRMPLHWSRRVIARMAAEGFKTWFRRPLFQVKIWFGAAIDPGRREISLVMEDLFKGVEHLARGKSMHTRWEPGRRPFRPAKAA